MPSRPAVQPQCRACREPVIWARDRGTGSAVMLDKDRDDTGTSLYAVERPVHGPLAVRVLAPGEQPRAGVEHRHQAHQDTCSQRPGRRDD